MAKVSNAHREVRRRQILMAAVACFSRRGFYKTRVKDICEEARLSPGAVYLYFENKEAIVRALAEASRAASQALWAEVEVGSGGALDRLEGLLGRLYSERDPSIARMSVQLWGEAIEDPFLRQIYIANRKQLVEKFADVLHSELDHARKDAVALGEITVAAIAGLELQKAIEPDTDVRPAMTALLRALRGEVGAGRETEKATPRKNPRPGGRPRRKSTGSKKARSAKP